jgi:hypothetical protein|tara:strand:- start:403 stop:900 length:498 start_codon:yes stop_codon:yes gene_type:complete
MSEIDHIIKSDKLVISKKTQFNMIDLYKSLKAWFDLHDYVFYEREYNDIIKKDKKSLKIKWEGQKAVDDYTKYEIILKISLKNYKIIETKQGNMVEGDLKMAFEADLETDYEEKWEKNAIFKFFRAISDKYLTTSKMEKYENELKEDTHDIFNRTKSYLNLQKFR